MNIDQGRQKTPSQSGRAGAMRQRRTGIVGDLFTRRGKVRAGWTPKEITAVLFDSRTLLRKSLFWKYLTTRGERI